MLSALLLIVGVFAALVAAVVAWVLSGKPSYKVEGSRRVLTSLPSQAYVFGMAIKKSLVGKKARAAVLPPLCLVQHGVQVSSAHVTQYRDICGFDVKGADTVPLTYPYLLIFPLQVSYYVTVIYNIVIRAMLLNKQYNTIQYNS
jgi:hypothetical protein